MHVHSVLSGGSPNIDADVVTVRRMICRNLALRAIKKCLYFGLLLGGHVKITRDVSAWYYQDMSTAKTVIVVTNIREGSLKQDTFGSAQLAIRNRHGIIPFSISVDASMTAPISSEGIAHVERLEFSEIAIVRVQRPDAVLEQDRGDVRVGDEIPADRDLTGHVLVRVDETVQFGHGACMGQPDQCRDVAERFVRRKRRGEDARVRGNAQIRHQRGPGQAEDLGAGGARFEEAAGASVTVARSIRRVKEYVHVEGVAHGLSASRAA